MYLDKTNLVFLLTVYLGIFICHNKTLLNQNIIQIHSTTYLETFTAHPTIASVSCNYELLVTRN